ncbi:uncharacterized protein LOC133337326 [Musca vetustissima]|uniref:uncharacterized protein LOC133337326 n=1 Tax=Musca vetustissima TaxID=27455 RepID=UPI002AB688E8|nr:uncharacterized protein LOC133337326 [Musca vetustissima]
MPYLALKVNESNNVVTYYEGFEGELLKYTADSLNFTTQIHWMDLEEINESFNDTGLIFKEIFSKSADFAIGAFYYKPNLNETSPYSQTTYYYLSYTYLVANVFNTYSPYEKIAYPFHLQLWYLIGLILTLSSLLILGCEASQRWRKLRNFIIGENNHMPQYHLYTLALGATVSSAQLPRYNFARFLLACWLLTTIVIRSAYQSGMYEMLRNNKHRNPPQTIADVIKQDYVILLKGYHKSLLSILPDMKKVREVNESLVDAFPQLAEANERTAAFTQYEYFGYLGKTNLATWRKLHLVNERIYTQQLTMYVRSQSYLVTELNARISNAQYFGFINHWVNKYFGRPTNAVGKFHQSNSTQTNILSINELGAVFMILLWLHLAAVGVFVMELLWHRYEAMVQRWAIKNRFFASLAVVVSNFTEHHN